MSGIGARLSVGASWMVGSRVAISIINLANTVVLARILVPEYFGLVAIVVTMAEIIGSITELSLTQALVQNRKPEDDHYHTAFTLNLIRSAVVAAIVCAISGVVAHVYGDPRLQPMMIVTGLATILTGLLNPKLVVYIRELVFWQDFLLRSSDRLFAFLGGLIVALIWQSYWALIVGMIAGRLVTVVISYALIPYLPRLKLNKWRELISFSGWLTLEQIVNTLNWRSDQLFVGYFVGNTVLGLYTVGSRLAAMPTREATQPIAQVAFPGFTHVAHDRDRLIKAYTRIQTLLTCLALPAGVGFAAIAGPAVLLFLGEKWVQSGIIIQVLASVFAIQTIGATVRPLAMALGATRALFLRGLVGFAIRLPLILVGLIVAGLPGLLVARCVSGIVGLIINLALVHKVTGISTASQILANWRSLLAALVMGIVVGGAEWAIHSTTNGALALEIFGLILLGAVVYPGTLFLAWIAVGRPDGPEREIQQILSKATSRLSRRRSVD